MKKLATILLSLFIVPLFALAQPAEVQNIISKYSGKDGITSVSFTDPTSVFSLIDSPELEQALKDVKLIKILNCHNLESNAEGKSLTADLKSLSTPSGFKEWMSVSEKGSDVKIMIKKNGAKVDELLMKAFNKTGTTMIWISGDIDLNKVKSLKDLISGPKRNKIKPKVKK